MRKLLRGVALLMLLCVMATSMPVVTFATTTEEKLEEEKKKKKQTEEQLKEAEENVDILTGRKQKLKGKLNNLNEELSGIADRLNELETSIIEKGEEISQTKEALAEAKRIEEEQYEAMKKRMQFMYENSSTLYLDILFNAKNFSDFITLNGYVDSLAEYESKKLSEYKASRKAIEDLEAHLEEEESELMVLRDNAQLEKDSILEVIDNTKSDIADYNDLIDDAEQTALEYEKQLESQNNNIKALQKQLEEEKRKSEEARKSHKRDISEVTFDEGDRFLIANIIYCEAGGEPYAGKVAVGAVVINRLLSSVFPDTVSGVIYQPNQFSPVASGRYASALAADKANADCYAAADEAMSGVTNVGDCVFFRTPIPGLTGIQIGNHIFY